MFQTIQIIRNYLSSLLSGSLAPLLSPLLRKKLFFDSSFPLFSMLMISLKEIQQFHFSVFWRRENYEDSHIPLQIYEYFSSSYNSPFQFASSCFPSSFLYRFYPATLPSSPSSLSSLLPLSLASLENSSTSWRLNFPPMKSKALSNDLSTETFLLNYSKFVQASLTAQYSAPIAQCKFF